MKCINKMYKKMMVSFLTVILVFFSTGCGAAPYTFDYNVDSEVSSFNVLYFAEGRKTSTYASNLCVVSRNILADDLTLDDVSAAFLFDINNNNVLFAKNVFVQVAPASLTKIMTAIVALKYGSLDQTLTASNAVNISEWGAQLAGITAGDKMTLGQALHILLIYSANDVANLIAENIGGSVEGFVEMMNAEAQRLGATNTHFTNAHGLDDPDHYTTAYDLYLMFNEAVKYSEFTEIIHMASYQTAFYDKSGKVKNLTVNTTNRYLKGTTNLPGNVTVIGGKTGSTSSAGNCLILLTRDINGAPYISCVMNCASADVMYENMTDLLKQITK